MIAFIAFVFALSSSPIEASSDARFAAIGSAANWTAVPSGAVAASAPSLFLGGTDDCNGAHVFLGTGPVTDVPFTTGTTGTQLQDATQCQYFGTPAITNDVWFDWTANQGGAAILSLCEGTAVDTKVAIWSDGGAPGGCPQSFPNLACNDDSCGLQTRVEWAVTAGATYTIQLGTFPGAMGGSGTFDISTQSALSCGRYDEVNGPTALGLTGGGEMAWLHYFECTPTVRTVSTAYGDEMFPGSISNGNHSWILVYEDASCDVDPTTDLVLKAALDTIVMNADTGVLNTHPIGPVSVQGCLWIGASADHVSGEFPGPMMAPGTAEAWVVGSQLGPGTLNIDDLNANDVAPLQMNALGFPCSWLLRIEAFSGPGTSYCSGNPAAACPCGNVSAPGAGCGNGSFVDGAQLAASGKPAPDSIVLSASQATPAQPGLFFQGDNRVNGGIGIQFGDGLRCAGGNVVRLEIVVADASGYATSSVSISTEGGALPGETKRYQYWYRDPALSPCGSGFNLTNGYEITW